MAAAGFYQHAPHSDAVSCFCCEVRMEGWHEQSDPIAEHQRASPSCPWNNGTYMTTLEERLGSFNTWPININPLPITMAAAGFYPQQGFRRRHMLQLQAQTSRLEENRRPNTVAYRTLFPAPPMCLDL